MAFLEHSINHRHILSAGFQLEDKPLVINFKPFPLLVAEGGMAGRVAQSAGIGGLDPSIAMDLIDSEDPKHTMFCRKITFVAIYTLFRDNISIL